MQVSEKIKKIMYNNPFAVARRKKMRSQLKNNNITFFAPSCIGGLLFHDLGLKFCSPTVNLMMFQPDFIKLVTNYEEYSAQKFEFYDDPDYPNFPCAHLKDIAIHFTHYHSNKEAETIWRKREKRIDWNNTFVFCTDRDGVTREEIEQLGKLNVRGVLVFSVKKELSDLPYVLYVPELNNNGEVDFVLDVHYPRGNRNYEKYFDWVKWFNEANGAPYDISPYCIKN